MPVDQHKIVRVFDLLSPNGIGDGYLGVDVTSTQVKAFYWFGERAYHWVVHNITTEDLQKGLGVLVRFGPDYESLALSVNGQMATQKNTSVSPPPLLGNVTRSLRLNSGYDGNGGFHLYEISVWNSALSDIDLATYSNAYYSSYVLGLGAAVRQPTGPGQPADPFSKVTAVFNKSRQTGSCVGCHGSISQKSWLLSQQSNGNPWIKAGDSGGSQIVKAIRRSTGATPMPPSGSAILESEIKIIEDWINSGAQ